MAFSPPVLGCLVKKGLQKEGSRAPQDPPGYTPGASDSDLTATQSFLNRSFERNYISVKIDIRSTGA